MRCSHACDKLPIPGQFMDTPRAANSSECNQGIYEALLVSYDTRGRSSHSRPGYGAVMYYLDPEDYGEPEDGDMIGTSWTPPAPSAIQGRRRRTPCVESNRELGPHAIARCSYGDFYTGTARGGPPHPAGSAPACREVSLAQPRQRDGAEDLDPSSTTPLPACAAVDDAARAARFVQNSPARTCQGPLQFASYLHSVQRRRSSYSRRRCPRPVAPRSSGRTRRT